MDFEVHFSSFTEVDKASDIVELYDFFYGAYLLSIVRIVLFPNMDNCEGGIVLAPIGK